MTQTGPGRHQVLVGQTAELFEISDHDTTPRSEGGTPAGSPETVARKIATTVDVLGAARFDLKYSAGTLPHDTMMRSIELYATEVAPRVRELLASRTAAIG